jgi:hypothetical protein
MNSTYQALLLRLLVGAGMASLGVVEINVRFHGGKVDAHHAVSGTRGLLSSDRQQWRRALAWLQ